MKVNVLTVENVKIGRWRWWSNWIYVAVFNFMSTGHLLQMRVSRTNAKQFRCRKFAGITGVPYANTFDAGDLAQMEREGQ